MATKTFASNVSGAAAVLFALILVPMLVAVGVALDISRATAARVRLQNAVDVAVLAGVRETTPQERRAVAARQFASSLAMVNLSNVQANWINNLDGTFTGEAQGVLTTTLMNIVGITQSKIGAKATGAADISVVNTPLSVSVTFKAASGWYWKQVTLWVHRPGDPQDTLLATYTYQPTNLFTATGVVGGPFGIPVSLGTNYDYAYFKMDVGQDGCGPLEAPLYPDAIDNYQTAYWDPYVCQPINPPSVVKKIAIVTMSTRDPLMANHLFVDGKMLTTGAVTSILRMVSCNQTVQHSWEDTPGTYDPTSSGNVAAWSAQDIFFDVTGGPCAVNAVLSTSAVRLVK